MKILLLQTVISAAQCCTERCGTQSQSHRLDERSMRVAFNSIDWTKDLPEHQAGYYPWQIWSGVRSREQLP